MNNNFLLVYNGMDETDTVSAEFISVDTIKHVWLRLPDKKQVTIEYINPATGKCRSMSEEYETMNDAMFRMSAIEKALNVGGRAYKGYPMPDWKARELEDKGER